MVSLSEVDKQLAAIGAHKRFRFWGRPEIIELQHILIPGEQIQACLNGRYAGGFAVLCATDQRLLLIDKKIFHLSVEDVRYDMIAEVDYSAQLASAEVKICTPNKNMAFVAFKPRDLRALVTYMQHRILELRQQHHLQQQHQALQAAAQAWQPANYPMPNTAPTPAPAAPVGLPSPEFRNPYLNTPLMIKRRIGRFGTLGSTAVEPRR